MTHFADRLADAIQHKRTPLCVGLDPRWQSLPEELRRRHGDSVEGRATAYEEFCIRVLDLVAPLVGVVKPQSAFFEACGPDGMRALLRIMRHARRLGLVTILDAKRNDIASTAEAYAEAAFNVYDADALTVNPYLGRDSIDPFLKIGRPLGKGLFVLVRTSNAGAGQFQDLVVKDEGGRRKAEPASSASSFIPHPSSLYSHVAHAVADWSRENVGVAGFGDVGAVVGATNPVELASLRQQLPGVMILVPGFGAQGAAAADAAGAFLPDGTGAVINSARAILFPFKPEAMDWEQAIERAARKAVDELAAQTPAGKLGQGRADGL